MTDKKQQNHVSQFRIWCMENRVTQKRLQELTHLSTGAINNLVHEGTNTRSTIKLVAMCLAEKGYDITEESLTQMLNGD